MSLFPGLDRAILESDAEDGPVSAGSSATRDPAPSWRKPVTLSSGIGQVLHGWKVDLPPPKPSNACKAVDCTKPRRERETYCPNVANASTSVSHRRAAPSCT